jgi:minor extracellular serine protease Vpr
MLKLNPRKNLVAIGVANILALSVPIVAYGQDLEKVSRPTSLEKIDANERIQSENIELVEVFIEFEDAAASTFSASSANSRLATASRAKKMDTLRSGMQKFRGQEMREKSSKRGVAWKVQAQDLEQLKKMPEVKRVSFIIPAQASLSNSVPWIGAPTVWNDLGNGDNNGQSAPVTIAIIDSGIDYYHAGFGGSGDPADFANNDPSVIEAGTFPTAKVLGGIDFAGADNAAFATDPDPVGVGSFHGTHVAGIAANIGAGDVAPGVAPGADLYAVKVFADNGGSTTVSHLGIQWAEDPNQDGDTSDRADVMNLSLGSSYGRTDDVSSMAAQEASKNGSIVVISAGNSGDVPYIHGGPAVAPGAISVANSLAGGLVQGVVATSTNAAANGSFLAIEGGHSNTFANGFTISGNLVAVDGLDGCAALTNAADVAANVALVIRGGCSFDAKYANAEAAGATGLVVYNDGADATRINPIGMGGVDPLRNLTGVMISFTDGDNIKAALDNGDAVSVYADQATKSVTNPSNDDTLAGSTSRGPGLDNSFKPDVAAPGTGIQSVLVGTGTGAGGATGTSMSAPHVAGVAALLKQKWPNLAPPAIKAMIQNSTTPAYRDGVAGSSDPYPLSLQGVGRVQADVASTLTGFAKPGGVSFGRVNAQWETYLSRKVTVRNLSNQSKVYSITHEPGQTMSGVEIKTFSTSVYVPARGTRTFKIAMDVNPNLAPFDAVSNSQSEVDGWFVLEDGQSGETLRIGYMAVVDPASGVTAYNEYKSLDFYNAGGSDGYAEGFTLAGKVKSKGKSSHDIDTFGYRTGVSLFGGAAIDFAFVSKGAWSSHSPLAILLDIDSDEDGIAETNMQITDFKTGARFDGVVDVSIFPGGYGLGAADYDYNDRVLIARFLTDRNGLAPDVGFLDAGDTNFDYTLTILNQFTGESSVLTGSIDLTKEVTVDINSFVMPKDGSASSALTSEKGGKMLWLYQQNVSKKQAQVIKIKTN